MTTLSRLKTRLFAYALFSDFIPIYPLYAVMFTDRGIGPAELSVLLFAWSATAFLLEVPSGAIADRYPRKYVLMFAEVAHALAYAAWLFMPNFWGFLVGFILWGIASAFSSGTVQALVYDELKKLDREADYTKTRGVMNSLQLTGNMIASFSAIAFVASGYELLLMLSVGFGLLNVAIVATLPKVKRTQSLDEETHYFDYLKRGVTYAVSHRAILRILAVSGVVLGLGSVDEYYTVFFKEQGLNNYMISFWDGVIVATGIVMSLTAAKVGSRMTPHGPSTALFISAWGATLLVATCGGSLLAPLVIVLFSAFFFLIQTVVDGWLQHAINEDARATITSVEGFIAELGALVTFIAVGLIAQVTSFTVGMQAVAVLIVLAGIAALVIRPKSATVDVHD